MDTVPGTDAPERAGPEIIYARRKAARDIDGTAPPEESQTPPAKPGVLKI